MFKACYNEKNYKQTCDNYSRSGATKRHEKAIQLVILTLIGTFKMEGKPI